MANEVNDLFGLNHPGALVVLGLSTLATFATMAVFAHHNEAAHEEMQREILRLDRDVDDLYESLRKHEHDAYAHPEMRRASSRALAAT